ncbi:MAG: hypothetical protein Kow0031_38010 [Anaerolineae bacterium]
MDALFNAPIPFNLTLDEIILMVTALDHHRLICEIAGNLDEASRYEAIINRLEQAGVPSVAILGQADDHAHCGLR